VRAELSISDTAGQQTAIEHYARSAKTLWVSLQGVYSPTQLKVLAVLITSGHLPMAALDSSSASSGSDSDFDRTKKSILEREGAAMATCCISGKTAEEDTVVFGHLLGRADKTRQMEGEYNSADGKIKLKHGEKRVIKYPRGVGSSVDSRIMLPMLAIFNTPLQNGHLLIGADGCISMSAELQAAQPEYNRFHGTKVRAACWRCSLPLDPDCHCVV